MLASDPERIGEVAGLQRMAHAREPDWDEAILARDQVGDLQGEVPIERERWQGLREGVRRQSAQPPGQPQGVCGLTQRLACADEVEGALALLDRRIAGHQREQQPRKAVGQVLDLTGTAGELGDVAAIAGVEGFQAPPSASGGRFLHLWEILPGVDGLHPTLCNSVRRPPVHCSC